MSVAAGPDIVEDGLVLAVDAGNTKSYPGTGSTWSDLSGNGTNMTIEGATYNSAGYFDFDGSNDYITVADCGLSLGEDVPFTLEMWVNFDTMGSTRWWLAVIGQYSSGAHHVIGRTTSASGQFGIWGGSQNQFSMGLIGTNSWKHVVSTSTGSVLKSFVDGIEVDSDAATDYNFIGVGGLVEFSIGFPIGGEAYYDGKCAIAKIYNRALSASEIAQNYNALKSRFGL